MTTRSRDQQLLAVLYRTQKEQVVHVPPVTLPMMELIGVPKLSDLDTLLALLVFWCVHTIMTTKVERKLSAVNDPAMINS